MIAHTCEACGEPFEHWPSRARKFCSVRCAGDDKAKKAAESYEPDPYDIEWQARLQDRRVERWLPLLTAGASALAARDRHGVQVLWERAVRAGDWQAFFTAALALVAELSEGETSSDEGRAA